MAALVAPISVEMDEMNDAIDRLRDIHIRLAKRHGGDFRRLDRAIEDFIEDPDDGVEAHWLGDGKMIVAPSGQLTEIFREARRLGVMD